MAYDSPKRALITNLKKEDRKVVMRRYEIEPLIAIVDFFEILKL